jgi:hypothetical protein
METTEEILNERCALYYSISYLASMYEGSKSNTAKDDIANLLHQIKIQYGIDSESVNNTLKKHYKNKNKS